MLYACVVSNSLNQNWFVPDSFETEIQQKLPDKNQIVTAFLRISKFISFQSMSFHFNKKNPFSSLYHMIFPPFSEVYRRSPS